MVPLSVGIVGCGVIANAAHLPATRDSTLVELAAVCDLIPERARAAFETYGARAWYTDASELMADDRVEAVILALPAGVRTSLAYEAFAHGKHALVEKPSALRLRELDEMERRAAELTVGFCSARFGFTDSATAAADCVRSGVLGSIRVVRSRSLLPAAPRSPKSPPPWRQSFSLNGGGILTNWGCYDLDYLLQVVGDTIEPVQVAAQWWPVAPEVAYLVGPKGDADSHYSAAVRCRGNILLSMERGEFTPTEKTVEWSIMGDRATLHLEMLLGDKQLVLDRFDPDVGVRREIVWQGTDPDDITVRMIEDFATAVREGRSPRTGFARAKVVQRIFDGIYDSAAAQRAIDI